MVRVADGDTLTVLDETYTRHKIRLQGIDAPEKKQPFGQKSKTYLTDKVALEYVKVQYGSKDRYGRIVGKVMLYGEDMNPRQINGGFAWHYKQYRNNQSGEDRGLCADAEIIPRKRKFGLWRDPKPVSPWEWRKGKR